jgi:hypothetical protein
MAHRLTDVSSRLERTTNIGPSTADFTCNLSFKPNADTSGGLHRVIFGIYDSAAGAATKFIELASAVGSNNYTLTINDGTSSTISGLTLSANSRNDLTYVRKGSVHYLYRGFTLVGQVTKNISGTISFARIVIGNDDPTSESNVDLAYYREWSAALSLKEIIIEQNSSRAYRTANLVADVPLLSTINDVSGNNNNFTAIGTAGSFITDIPGSPVDISGQTFPYNRVVTVAEFNVANQFWFKYTPSVLIALGEYTSSPVTMVTTMYRDDGVTTIAGPGAGNKGFYSIVGTGSYYIKILKSGGGGIAADITAFFETGVVNPAIGTIPAGSFIINDDLPLPGTIFSPAGAFLGIFFQIPAGEIGAGLPSGVTLWHDRYLMYGLSPLVLLDASLNLISSFDLSPGISGSAAPIIICANLTEFYVLMRGTTSAIWKVTASGIFTDTGVDVVSVSGFNPSAFAVNNAATILYWTEGSGSPRNIHRWDMIGNVALSDLFASGITNGYIGLTAVNNHPGEILYLPNDTIVTWYFDNNTNTTTVVHLSIAGAVLHSWPFTGTFSFIDHMSYHAETNKVTVWFFRGEFDDTQGRFVTLDLTDGSFDSDFTSDLFSDGVNLFGGSQIIGPSHSCTMITFGFGEGPPPPPPGTGVIVVTKTTIPVTTQRFRFIATGMDPVEFELGNGESQVFSGLVPGSNYSVQELTEAGWSVVWTVSNGSPITGITVTAGQTTTATAQNSQVSAIGKGGIYKIVPGKRNDTLWVDSLLGTTQIVKIPRPAIRSSLIGE